MSNLVKIILAAAALILVAFGQARADGWEVNNIWWNVIINYNNSHQTMCLAEQFNNQTFAAVTFDIYPAPNTKPPRHGTAIQRDMEPYAQYRIFAWPDDTKPAPKCVLTGWQFVGKKTVRIHARDIRPSQRHP